MISPSLLTHPQTISWSLYYTGIGYSYIFVFKIEFRTTGVSGFSIISRLVWQPIGKEMIYSWPDWILYNLSSHKAVLLRKVFVSFSFFFFFGDFPVFCPKGVLLLNPGPHFEYFKKHSKFPWGLEVKSFTSKSKTLFPNSCPYSQWLNALIGLLILKQ